MLSVKIVRTRVWHDTHYLLARRVIPPAEDEPAAYNAILQSGYIREIEAMSDRVLLDPT